MKKILVADDDPHVLFLISEVLTRGHYEVSQAVNGYMAMQQVSGVMPDLVVLDVMMPGIDGFEICRRIKNDPALRHIKVIMVTAKTQGRDIQAGLSAGADHYITKPFKIAELSSKIKKLIG
ncbi:MAG: response regulator [Candidatus Edwardsbacteria bacterium]|nr:response regulator [Candidatus Edwardsbacteria bacterium]